MTALLGLSRATDIISLTILVDGASLPAGVAAQTVEIQQHVNRIPSARLRLRDGDPSRPDFALSTGALFVPGNEVVVLAGYQGETEEIFRGIVTRQRLGVRREGSWLEVECRDRALKMTLTRRNRVFEDTTDSELIETLLGEYELDKDIAATDVTHAELVQYQASDWDYMLSRLEANGQLCAVSGGSVQSFVPALDAEPVAELLYGNCVFELDAEFDARDQSRAVTATAWDPAAQDLIEVAANDPAWAGNGNLSVDDMVAATGRDEDQLWHGGVVTADALQAWADGALLRSRLSACRGRARFQGVAAVKPGSIVQLSGFGERFNGKVFVTGVRHELSDNDWFTDAEFGLPRTSYAELHPTAAHLPAAGLAPAVSGLQVGVVTQLAGDPTEEHRIRVKVPIASMDEQGLWARVATLDAGNGRGTFFRPEIDDEVVLGFFHADPSQPVVLGMLHSSAKAPPLMATDENHEKVYVSRAGIRLAFDDDAKAVLLETPDHNKLSLSDDDGGLTLEDQNGNTIKLSSDGIAITSAKDLILKADGDLKIDAKNVQLKASVGFKAEGSASSEVSSSGTLTLKGSLVQIN